jgi:hypothetical protein
MNFKWKKAMTLVISTALLLPPAAAFAQTEKNDAVATAAVELRSGVSQLLGEHALLAVVAMQKGIDGADDFDAVAGALMANADDLSAAIASVYGAEAGKAFESLWKQHIGFFVDYVVATAKKDEAGKQAALDKLANYRTDFSNFLASANPNLKASALADGLQMHVNQLVSAFDSYVAGDYTTTYNSIRESYGHMFMTGSALSGAIVAQFPQNFHNTSTTSAAGNLRIAVEQLLGEHAMLAVVAMQKGIDGKADFNAAAGALLANADDLSAAIASVYGAEAGKAFESLWKQHIGFFVDYVVATSKNDATGKQAALDKLDNYRTDFSNFLASANPNLEASALADGLQTHVDQLVGAFDSYVADKNTETYANVRAAYGHMFMTGKALSGAIVAQFPEKFAEKKMDAPAVKITAKLQLGLDTLLVNNNEIKLDVAPFVKEGRTFVSLRSLSEAVGATVKWDASTKTVLVITEDAEFKFPVGQNVAFKNGTQISVGAEVFIQDGRTQVPLRFIAEQLDWTVSYEAETNTIVLTK